MHDKISNDISNAYKFNYLNPGSSQTQILSSGEWLKWFHLNRQGANIDLPI